MQTCPALFISHGSPRFALEPGLLGPKLAQLGTELADISAVLMVSAHWQTRDVSVTTAATPETVHDFGGFPEALYRLQYPAMGAPLLAVETARLLQGAGFRVSVDERRGLDHGAWVPLLHMYPRADVPVYQVSLPVDLDTAGAMRLGTALAPLRKRGVLVVGSGGLTHNLREYFGGGAAASVYTQQFVDWARARLQHRNTDELRRYRTLAPQATRAHPSEEHFMPLLVAFGASTDNDSFTPIDGGIDHGVLSMDSFAWGLDAVSLHAAPAIET